MYPITPKQFTALTFARQHDWGRRARIERGRIVDLDDIEVDTRTGHITARTAAVPATLAAVREFGGY